MDEGSEHLHKKYLVSFTIILFLVIIVTSSFQNQEPFANTLGSTPYHLKIAVVGELPPIHEKGIEFTKITLSEVNEGILTGIDALFIMPENLREAAEAQYAQLYDRLPYPTFFVGSDRPYYAYTDKTLNYDNAIAVQDGMYTHGYIKVGGNIRTWRFGLYNDIRNDQNIKAMYYDVFDAITAFREQRSDKSRS